MKIEVIPNEQTPKVSKIIDIIKFQKENKELLLKFKSFVSFLDNVAGLAANQVSIDGKRLMINMFALKNRKDDEWELIFNPEIITELGGKEFKLEGCLTWKDKAILAERSEIIGVNYYDENGMHHTNESYRAFNAQVWQHEINHLNGIEEMVVNLNYKMPPKIKISRNDPCPCNSGKKYKNCCGKL